MLPVRAIPVRAVRVAADGPAYSGSGGSGSGGSPVSLFGGIRLGRFASEPVRRVPAWAARQLADSGASGLGFCRCQGWMGWTPHTLELRKLGGFGILT